MNFFLTIVLVFQTFLFFLFDSAIAGCLPSKSSAASSCTLCDFSTYTADFMINPCQSQKKSLYRRQVFVDSSAEICGATCDGSISSPFSGLSSALERESRASLLFFSSEIEILLLSSKHSLQPTEGDISSSTRIEFFRRNYAAITLRPAYCDEFNVTNCLDIGIKPTIKMPPHTIFFYVSRSLLVQNITFQGIPICDDEATS